MSLTCASKPNREQMEKIRFIESVTFQFFRGNTEEDADRFIAINQGEASRLAHKQKMIKKRKGRNRYNGLPVKVKN